MPLYPELEKVGPLQFDVTKIEQWVHERQQGGLFMNGEELHSYIAANILNSCLGLTELLAIADRGYYFVLQHFGQVGPYGHRGAARNQKGELFVPYINRSGRHDAQKKAFVSWDQFKIAIECMRTLRFPS